MTLKYMYSSSASEKKWMASFAIIDAMFWVFLGGTCLFSFQDCAPALAFGPTGFYAPFWFWMARSSVNFGMATGLVLLGISGILGHVLIGWLLGRVFHNRVISWHATIPSAAAVAFVTSVLGNMLGLAIGIFM